MDFRPVIHGIFNISTLYMCCFIIRTGHLIRWAGRTAGMKRTRHVDGQTAMLVRMLLCKDRQTDNLIENWYI